MSESNNRLVFPVFFNLCIDENQNLIVNTINKIIAVTNTANATATSKIVCVCVYIHDGVTSLNDDHNAPVTGD